MGSIPNDAALMPSVDVDVDMGIGSVKSTIPGLKILWMGSTGDE